MKDSGFAPRDTEEANTRNGQIAVRFVVQKIRTLGEWSVKSAVTGRTARFFKTERGALKYADKLNRQYDNVDRVCQEVRKASTDATLADK